MRPWMTTSVARYFWRMGSFSKRWTSLCVTASFGVAMLYPGETGPEPVLRRADKALYAAKAAGRDRVVAEGFAA